LARFAEILCLYRDELCVAVQRRCFYLAALGTLEIAGLKVADRVAELVLCIFPQVRRQFRSLCVSRVLAALQSLRQRGSRQLGRFRRVGEIVGGFRGVGSHVLDIAAALQCLFSILVLAHAALVGARCQPLGIDGIGGRLGGIRVLEEGASQFILRQS
jgi:hypothetical protein